MNIIAPNDTFTRPADTTAYTAGDLIANSTTAGSVTPLKFSLNGVGRSGILRRVRIYKSGTTATAASFTLHLFDASPTVNAGDNGAFAITSSMTNYLGSVALDMSSGAETGNSAGLTDASAAVAVPLSLPNAGGIIYGLLEAVGGYTPASAEVFRVWAEIEG